MEKDRKQICILLTLQSYYPLNFSVCLNFFRNGESIRFRLRMAYISKYWLKPNNSINSSQRLLSVFNLVLDILYSVLKVSTV